MSKTHVVNLHLNNNSKGTLVFGDDWFDSGRLADGNRWPPSIAPNASATVQCYEKDGSLAGCSGWVKYTLNGAPIYFCFSNPSVGTNGIDIGTTTSTWDGMGSHYYPVERPIALPDGTWLNTTITSTSGDVNEATWQVKSCDVSTVVPANLELANVETVWQALPDAGSRRYFKCDDSPTSLTGLAKSHFKGLGVYQDKFIFTHTNLGLTGDGDNGKYVIADQFHDLKWSQAQTDGTFDTLHQGWPHPCSSQVCGSFMAMGIQAAESGPGASTSEIQILDVRLAEVNQPAKLIATIPHPEDGVNGVGMTKESGPDGKYLVAGINGTCLYVWRSRTSSLLGGPVQFDRVLKQTIEDSGPGLALVTQQNDGAIYMFALNAVAGEDKNQLNLYKLDLQSTPTKCTQVGTKNMHIPGVSDTVTLLTQYVAVLGPVFAALLAEFGAPYLNTSFRWGKGLEVTSANTIRAYASDRNVIPLSQIPVVGSDKDFSVVTWCSTGSTWSNQVYVAFQANDPGHALYVTTSADGSRFTTPATGYGGILMGSAPALAVFGGQLYVAFRANDAGHALYVSSSADGVNFGSPAVGYEGILLGSAPAMTVFGDRLFIAFRANDQGNILYVTSSQDGRNFTTPAVGYPGIAMGGAPALAVFNGKLFAAFQANDPSQALYVTSSADGTNFTSPAIGYPGISIGSDPAMAFFNGRLYVAFQANDPSHTLYVTSSADGTNFKTPAVAYPGISIGGAPAMTVANGRLYVAFEANDPSHMLYVTSSVDGTNFTSPAVGYPGISIGSAPAMVEFWGVVPDTTSRATLALAGTT
jgi:hypothetical protein